MQPPKKYTKGRHQRIDGGKGVKEFRKVKEKETPTAPPAQAAKPTPPSGQLQIEIDDATAQGTYANMAAVAHSPTEFVIDFLFMPPGQHRGKVRSRIISSPLHAKRFLSALAENVRRYEAAYGPIVEPRVPHAAGPTAAGNA
jgi:hypothetical protein